MASPESAVRGQQNDGNYKFALHVVSPDPAVSGRQYDGDGESYWLASNCFIVRWRRKVIQNNFNKRQKTYGYERAKNDDRQICI